MAELALIRRVNIVSPTTAEIVLSAVNGNTRINEFDTNISYTKDSIVYRVENGATAVYRANTYITSGSEFNPDQWSVINILDKYGGTVISEFEPVDGGVDTWIKPMRFAQYDIELMEMEIDPDDLTFSYVYKPNASSGTITYADISNVPVGATPNNTYAVVSGLRSGVVITGSRSFPKTAHGFPVKVAGIGSGDGIFSTQSNETSVIFHTGSIETLSANVFAGWSGLHTLIIDSSLKRIGSNVFTNSTSITSLDIPDTVTEINANALTMSGITTVTVRGFNTVIADTALDGVTSIIAQIGSTANTYATANSIAFTALT